MSTTDTRAEFEAWAQSPEGGRWEFESFARFEEGPQAGRYTNSRLEGEWQAYQAATEAAKATGTAGELPPLPDPLEINWPELNSNALGCGVEDRNIRDRYDAAEYGWQDGVDKAIWSVPEAIYDADQMRTYGQACAEAARQPAPVVSNDLRNAAQLIMDLYDDMRMGKESIPAFDALRAALAATAAPVRNEADERDNEIFDLQKALAFWLPQVNQFMSDEMSQRIAHDAYMLVIDGNLPDDFKTAQELGWILPATGKVQRDAEMVCGNCMEPIPTTVMDTSSTRAPAAALSDESIDELAKPLMEQCVIVYGDMRRFARAIIAATRSQP